MTSRSRGAMLQATATDGRGAETDLGRLVSERKEAHAKRSALLQSQYLLHGDDRYAVVSSRQRNTMTRAAWGTARFSHRFPFPVYPVFRPAPLLAPRPPLYFYL